MIFPATHYSAVRGASSPDCVERSRAWDVLAAAYWQPVFKYVALKWRVDSAEAKDLTQGFFAAAIEKDHFASYDRSKASFRTFLRVCVDGYVSNERKAAARIKRGGTSERVDADDRIAGASLDDYFRDEWVRSMFSMAVEELRRLSDDRGKTIAYRLFARYDLEDEGRDPEANYKLLAAEFAVPVTQVTNHLAWARREFRRIVLERLREITADNQEFETEAQLLLGICPN
jgi:DNA-directed RNA polymerase specialized sigma24 family protein